MKKVLLLCCVFSLLFSGCATQTFYVNGDTSKEEPDYQEMQSFWIAGVGQEKTINAAKVCGGADKIAKVQTEMTLLNGVLSYLTWGIYTPRKSRVYCKK